MLISLYFYIGFDKTAFEFWFCFGFVFVFTYLFHFPEDIHKHIHDRICLVVTTAGEADTGDQINSHDSASNGGVNSSVGGMSHKSATEPLPPWSECTPLSPLAVVNITAAKDRPECRKTRRDMICKLEPGLREGSGVGSTTVVTVTPKARAAT